MIVCSAVHKTLSILCRVLNCGLYSSLSWRETSSLELQDKHLLRVFESRVQREVFGSKEIEVTGK